MIKLPISRLAILFCPAKFFQDLKTSTQGMSPRSKFTKLLLPTKYKSEWEKRGLQQYNNNKEV